jgi:hypothetical protein
MKKIAFILLLCPILTFGQSLIEILNDPTKVDTATVYTETGILDFNRSVGQSLSSGGAFLLLGTVTTIITVKTPAFYTKKYAELSQEYADYQKKVRLGFEIASYTFYGVSAACFITAGILYQKQIKLRKNVKINASPVNLSLTYTF